MTADDGSTPPSRKALSLADLEAFDPPQGSGPEKICRCPICQASERAFHFNTQTGAYNCKRASCGVTGKLSDFWQERPKQSRQQRARNALHAAFDLKPTIHAQNPINDPQQGAEPQETASSKTASSVSAFDWRELWETALPLTAPEAATGAEYLVRRGIELDVATSAGVRFCRRWIGGAAVVFPIYAEPLANGELNLVAAQGRHLKGDGKRTAGVLKQGVFVAAWRASSGREYSPFDKAAPAVIVCEAPIDALSIAAAGYPALALCGVAAPEWLHRACAFKRILLAFDADQAGDKAAGVLWPSLASFGARCERLAPEGAKDWNEMLCTSGKEDLSHWLAARVL